MRVLRWLGIGVLVCFVSTLAYCTVLWPKYRWHQKMTIEVEQDGQLYKGSSVTSVYWKKNDSIGAMHGPAWLSGVRGEAVVVELPGKRYLFALLSYSGNTEFTAHLATRVMANETKHRVWGKKPFKAVLAQKGKSPLIVPLANYPLLVTFKDVRDPASVQKVNPLHLAASFGKGVTLKNITLEITDEPVKYGNAEGVLSWLKEFKKNGFRLNGKKCIACPIKSENIADLLSASQFKIGD